MCRGPSLRGRGGVRRANREEPGPQHTWWGEAPDSAHMGPPRAPHAFPTSSPAVPAPRPPRPGLCGVPAAYTIPPHPGATPLSQALAHPMRGHLPLPPSWGHCPALAGLPVWAPPPRLPCNVGCLGSARHLLGQRQTGRYQLGAPALYHCRWDSCGVNASRGTDPLPPDWAHSPSSPNSTSRRGPEGAGGAHGAEAQPASGSLLSLTPQRGPSGALPAISILGPVPSHPDHLPHRHPPPSGPECQSPQRSPRGPADSPPHRRGVPGPGPAVSSRQRGPRTRVPGGGRARPLSPSRAGQ